MSDPFTYNPPFHTCPGVVPQQGDPGGMPEGVHIHVSMQELSADRIGELAQSSQAQLDKNLDAAQAVNDEFYATIDRIRSTQ